MKKIALLITLISILVPSAVTSQDALDYQCQRAKNIINQSLAYMKDGMSQYEAKLIISGAFHVKKDASLVNLINEMIDLIYSGKVNPNALMDQYWNERCIRITQINYAGDDQPAPAVVSP